MAFTVTFSEVQGWPKLIRYTPDVVEFERKLRCAWASVDTLANELVAVANCVYPYNTSGAVLEAVAYEPLPGAKAGYSGNTTKASYEQAIVTARYSTSGPRHDGSNFYMERLVPFIEFAPSNTGGLYWSTGAPVAVTLSTIPHPHVGLNYTLTYFRYPIGAGLPGAWFTAAGCLNTGTMATKLMGYTFPAETVLYRGVATSYSLSSSGAVEFRADLAFTFSPRPAANGTPQGWNAQWDALRGGYYLVQNAAGTTVKQFPNASFSF